MAEANDQELDVEVAGQHFRTKGYRLVDLIWLPLVLGTAYCSLTLWQHEATAQSERSAVAKTLSENNAAVAQTLRESNKAVVDALKEANENTLRAIRDLTTEQKRSTKAMKEMACLSDPAIKNRNDAREFCKRMSRDEG